jgi:periplasmic protein TonB
MKHILTSALALALAVSAVPASANPAWQGAVAKMIAAKQVYPRAAQAKGEQGTTRLRVAIATDGGVGAVQVVQSSGSPVLDSEAQKVLQGIGKFPAPPAGATTLVMAIVWKL